MFIPKKRRGRPRQNRPTIDSGTNELQQKRRRAVHGDPVLAESLLGILYGRQLISKPLYEAGRFFGELGYRYEPCLGHQFRQNSSVLTYSIKNGKGANPLYWSDMQDEKRTTAWRKALIALKKAGVGPYKTVLDVVFYDQDLYEVPWSKSIIPFVKPLRTGLASLDSYFTAGFQGGQGKRRDRGRNSVRATSFQPPLKEPRFSSPP
ncbi:MAG: hypothetical protein H0X26_02045 [Alphaproteobacteria bacterium]|nr:hypothetical protein [Alphaproteobacteria bacterium]